MPNKLPEKNNINEIYQLKYLVLPDFLFGLNLTGIQLKVAAFIYSFKGKKFYFSNEHLAEMFNCSVPSITRAINELEKLGLIKVHYSPKAGGGTSRFISRLINPDESDSSTLISPTNQGRLANDNNINDNNINNTLSKDNGKPLLEEFEKKKKELKELVDKLGGGRVNHDWQEAALRYAEDLGIDFDSPEAKKNNLRSRWFRLFKDAYEKNQRGKIAAACSFAVDYPKELKPLEKAKLFFWRFFNAV